ncbi:M48 family metallopeptidase [Parvularcula lutaonensis]|uniref:M48 family metallopeptidase n=1 Tax=Parvularcula lutaonensis TaxID=491923 RepID=A0ABV7MEE0_9PROT|nr:M48 family metallopeptidase [Parvularcula lutaonensis]
MARFLRRSIIAAAMAVLGVAACTYNEELGRSQLLFTGPDSMAQAAASSWEQLKTQRTISNDPRYVSRLNRVAPRLIRAAGEDPSKWEYLVFEDPSLNAFALPGGRIGIHTGIMDIMKNDAQLAAVVGHEIAHVKYRHSAERYSQNVLASVGLGAASIAVGANCEGTAAERRACEQRSGALIQALGLGAIYGAILPYSRKHELEADTGGVRYMARAGYDPCEAIRFWKQMQAASAGQARPPEFASTHPASETRIRNLTEIVRKQGRTCS